MVSLIISVISRALFSAGSPWLDNYSRMREEEEKVGWATSLKDTFSACFQSV